MTINSSFALAAAANAVCIAREIPDDLLLGRLRLNIDGMETVSKAGILLARFETALPDLWNEADWEDTCAEIVKVLAAGQPVTPEVLARLLGLAKVPDLTFDDADPVA